MRFFKRAVRSIQRRAVKFVLPNPRASHGEYSIIYDTLNTCGGPNDYLIDLALRAAHEAWQTELPDLSRRIDADSHDFTRGWPGEHYRFLAALVKLLQHERVLEIETFRGLSALALKKILPSAVKIVTFDFLPWKSLSDTCLRPDYFENDGFDQHI